MARKYHQTSKDREHESRGMKKYERKSHNPGGMRGYDRNDGMAGNHGRYGMDSGYMGMISEDHYAPSNLPQEVKHEYYAKLDYADNYYLDDTIRGIDDNIDDSIRKVERNQSDSMY